MATRKNWAGTIEYSTGDLHLPRTVDQVQELVASATAVGVLGSRHSFNSIADTTGTLISLEALDPGIRIDAERSTVTLAGGVRYGELGAVLQSAGFALGNLASLPHISVAGAVATATHGSGMRSPNLAGAVSGLDLVTADGELLRLDRSHADFAGAVVGLGALGVVTAVTLDIEPTFEVAVTAYQDLDWPTLAENFDAVMGAAWSVSVFTDYAAPRIAQVWVKHRVGVEQPPADLFGARPATRRLHPLPGIDAEACTEQLGIAGPWIDRLPHFRLDFTPSNGAEIQSEYLLPRHDAPAAIEALRGIGDILSPVLQVSEIRTIAADELWLSTAQGRDSVAFHFTWKLMPEAVAAVLPLVEAALAPFAARPHWGKSFVAPAAELVPRYPRMTDFRSLATRLDPDQVFVNDFLRRHVLGD